MSENALHAARAQVLHDLAARALDSPAVVDVVEDAVAARRWWVTEWPAGAEAVAGQLAQDVQERLLDDHALRWPECVGCSQPVVHVLRITPDLGPGPRWVCEDTGLDVAPLSGLPTHGDDGG